MKTEPFWLFDTAGNTTLLVENPDILLEALAIIAAEQAGAFRQGQLIMAGGEFCANACLALAAQLALLNIKQAQIEIAQQQVALGCLGKAPEWQAWAEFSSVCIRQEKINEIDVTHMPGITHALIECGSFPESESAIRYAKNFWNAVEGEGAPARGTIWWNKSNGKIYPLVEVPAAGTCNFEGACGSGSIALAFSMGIGRHRIIQPSGSYLDVEIGNSSIRLAGKVHLAASGNLWLPD